MDDDSGFSREGEADWSLVGHDSHSDADTDFDGHSDADAYSQRNCNGHVDTYLDAERDCNGDTDIYLNAERNCHSDADCHADGFDLRSDDAHRSGDARRWGHAQRPEGGDEDTNDGYDNLDTGSGRDGSRDCGDNWG